MLLSSIRCDMQCCMFIIVTSCLLLHIFIRSAQAANRASLRAIKRAYQRHKPHFLLYVDRWAARWLAACFPPPDGW